MGGPVQGGGWAGRLSRWSRFGTTRARRAWSAPGARVTVVHAGRVIVDSDRCWRVLETSHPPVYHVPRDDIADAVLEPGEGRSYCEFKGVAGYWDLVAGSTRVHADRRSGRFLSAMMSDPQ